MNIHIKLILFLFVWFTFSNTQSFSQNKKIVDSLNKLYQKTKEDTLKITYLIDIAYQYRYSKPDTSLHILKQAWSIAEKKDIQAAKAQCLSESGYVLWVQTKFDTAISYANRSLAISTKMNFKKTTARSLQLLGMCYRDFGNYPLSLDYMFQALKINEEIKNKKEIANCYNNIGELYKLQENYTFSLDYYFKSLNIRLSLKDLHGLARIYINIAEVYVIQNKFDEALDFSYKSLTYCEQINNKLQITHNYTAITDIYIYQSKYQQAIETATKSLELNKKLKNSKGIAKNLYQISSIYQKTHKTDLAIEFANQALETATPLKLMSIIYHASSILHQIYKQQNNTSQALYYYEMSNVAKDSMFSIEKNKKILQIKFGYELEKKQKEIEIAEKNEVIALQKSKEQRYLTFLFAAGFILVFLMAATIFRSRRKLQKTYQLVSEQNDMILEKNEELNQLNEEIVAQKDNLQVLSDDLQLRNTEITQKKNEIELKNLKITQSISYAKRIQQAILPSEEFISTIFPENFILFKPRDIVSGDFFWFNRINENLIVSAGDCTGHGVPGAFMSMLGISLINQIINNRENVKANLILNELRRNIKKMLGQGGKLSEAKDGIDIAICIIQVPELIMQFAGANNSVYFFRKNDSKYEFIEIKGDRMPIGTHPNDSKDFTNHEIQLLTNDTFYLFSDGFSSQFSSKSGEKFKLSRFRDTLMQIQGVSMDMQKQRLENVFIEWKGDFKQVDDILVIGIKISDDMQKALIQSKNIFNWNNNLFDTGCTEIDLEHKNIVIKANQLYNVFKQNTDKAATILKINEITDLVIEHFHTEEKYLKRYDEPECAQHIAEHNSFIRNLIDLRISIQKQETQISDLIITNIKERFIQHITTIDFRDKHYFNPSTTN